MDNLEKLKFDSAFRSSINCEHFRLCGNRNFIPNIFNCCTLSFVFDYCFLSSISTLKLILYLFQLKKYNTTMSVSLFAVSPMISCNSSAASIFALVASEATSDLKKQYFNDIIHSSTYSRDTEKTKNCHIIHFTL